jgi:hypothetical protein
LVDGDAVEDVLVTVVAISVDVVGVVASVSAPVRRRRRAVGWAAVGGGVDLAVEAGEFGGDADA